jgi:predicted metalloendopeptidase
VLITDYNKKNTVEGPVSNEDKKQFFKNYARIWCARTNHGQQCDQVFNDPHALSKHRVDKTLRQLAFFAETFECTPNISVSAPNDNTTTITTMINPKPCVVY